jgi:hypothetical protein
LDPISSNVVSESASTLWAGSLRRAAPRADAPDFERADQRAGQIGEFSANPKSRSFAGLLIDCEEDRTLRAMLVWMLREADRLGPGRR